MAPLASVVVRNCLSRLPGAEIGVAVCRQVELIVVLRRRSRIVTTHGARQGWPILCRWAVLGAPQHARTLGQCAQRRGSSDRCTGARAVRCVQSTHLLGHLFESRLLRCCFYRCCLYRSWRKRLCFAAGPAAPDAQSAQRHALILAHRALQAQWCAGYPAPDCCVGAGPQQAACSSLVSARSRSVAAQSFKNFMHCSLAGILA